MSPKRRQLEQQQREQQARLVLQAFDADRAEETPEERAAAERAMTRAYMPAQFRRRP